MEQMDEHDLLTTTCPSREELDRALTALESIGAPYRRIDPTPPLARVALPALVVSRETRARLAERNSDVVFSGWVEHRTPLVRTRRASGSVISIEAGCSTTWLFVTTQPSGVRTTPEPLPSGAWRARRPRPPRSSRQPRTQS
jgi:hypothetical protein